MNNEAKMTNSAVFASKSIEQILAELQGNAKIGLLMAKADEKRKISGP